MQAFESASAKMQTLWYRRLAKSAHPDQRQSPARCRALPGSRAPELSLLPRYWHFTAKGQYRLELAISLVSRRHQPTRPRLKTTQHPASRPEQSANLPQGRASGTRLRKLFCRLNSLLRVIDHQFRNASPSLACSLSHRLKVSFAALATNTAACRDDNRSLVCPANCGSTSLALRT